MNLSKLSTGSLLLALTAAGAAFLTAAPSSNAPTKNRSLGISPMSPNELWVVNKDNDTVVVLNRLTGAVVTSIPVGKSPRNVAFNSSGSKAYVTNERGNVDLDKTFREYDGSEILGSVSVIDTATKSVVKTITQGLGAEPFGIALAPNGAYLLVTNFRSHSLSVIDPSTDDVVLTLAYDANLNFLPSGKTLADLDSNDDFIADFEGPRAIAIAASSDRAYITHLRSGFVSVISLALGGNGVPTSMAVAKRINLNKYPFDAFHNPVKITQALSQGNTRFLDDITITPDGTKAWLPHVLLNVNHDVNVPFNPGAFANRVYGAISILDITSESFEYGDPIKTDSSNRLHFDWNVPAVPTMNVHYGLTTGEFSRRLPTLRAVTPPVLGTNLTLRIEHGRAGTSYELYVGRLETSSTTSFGGKALIIPTGVVAQGTLDANGTATFTMPIPNLPAISDLSLYFQAAIGLSDPSPNLLTNAVRAIFGPANEVIPPDTLPVRLAQPSMVEFSPDGRRALVLQRGSEDVAVFDISGSSVQFMGISPRRDSTPSATQIDKNHTPFAASRIVGDRPTGMLLADVDVANDLASLLVNNEASRDVGLLKVNFTTGVVGNPSGSLAKIVPPANDKFTELERIGEEIFTDGSRAQTTGGFAMSCESCHYEGGEDGNVWQRSAGPRSTIAMYGGIRRTGFLLWKAVRMNLGETGPMFDGENGGHGIFTNQETEALIAYAEKIPVPLNGNLVNGQLTPQAMIGRDLFLATNVTGTNPTGRSANCQSCHMIEFPDGEPAWFTNDRIKILDDQFDAAHQDPCISLKENIMGNIIADVNSGVNVEDEFGFLIIDRNNDGIPDVESYVPMNIDKDDDFTRDDPNNVDCDDPGNPGFPLEFKRPARRFDVPTKLGVFFTGPYFHDHAVRSLRSTVDPLSQQAPAPLLNKLRNTAHDMRGTDVQQFLGSTNVNDDIDAMLSFIESL